MSDDTLPELTLRDEDQLREELEALRRRYKREKRDNDPGQYLTQGKLWGLEFAFGERDHI